MTKYVIDFPDGISAVVAKKPYFLNETDVMRIPVSQLELYVEPNAAEYAKAEKRVIELPADVIAALMSRLWTGFFGTERCRTPKIFQNPDFSLKRRDFWGVFVGGTGLSPAGERKRVV